MQKTTRIKIASLTSNIINPFLVSLAVIILLAFKAASSTLSAFRWSVVIAMINIAPVLVITIYLIRKGKLASLVTSVRQQRTEIYLLAGAVTAIDYVILRYVHAPQHLIAAVATGLLGLMIFMCINFWWKISLHTAFITGLITIMIIVYGWVAAFGIVLVLLTGWARIELGEHTIAQVIAGALLAAAIGAVSFNLFGLL